MSCFLSATPGMTHQKTDSNCRLYSTQFVGVVWIANFKKSQGRYAQNRCTEIHLWQQNLKETTTNNFSTSCVTVCVCVCVCQRVAQSVLVHSSQSQAASLRLAGLLLFQSDSDGLRGCLAGIVVLNVFRVTVLTKAAIAKRSASAISQCCSSYTCYLAASQWRD